MTTATTLYIQTPHVVEHGAVTLSAADIAATVAAANGVVAPQTGNAAAAAAAMYATKRRRRNVKRYE